MTRIGHGSSISRELDFPRKASRARKFRKFYP
jgi:hypothetical protein